MQPFSVCTNNCNGCGSDLLLSCDLATHLGHSTKILISAVFCWPSTKLQPAFKNGSFCDQNKNYRLPFQPNTCIFFNAFSNMTVSTSNEQIKKEMIVNKKLYSTPISQKDNNNPRMSGSLTTQPIIAADLFLPLVSEVA